MLVSMSDDHAEIASDPGSGGFRVSKRSSPSPWESMPTQGIS